MLLSRLHGMEDESQNRSPFENLSFDKKVEIGELLNHKDLLSYGAISHEFDEARGLVLKSTRSLRGYRYRIDGIEFTEYRIALLGRYKALDLWVINADDEAINKIIKLENLHTLWIEIKLGTSLEALKEFLKLPSLTAISITSPREHFDYARREGIYKGYSLKKINIMVDTKYIS